jgi:hypothetical protein
VALSARSRSGVYGGTAGVERAGSPRSAVNLEFRR